MSRHILGSAVITLGLIGASLTGMPSPARASDGAELYIEPVKVSLPLDGEYCHQVYLNYRMIVDDTYAAWNLDSIDVLSMYAYGYGSKSDFVSALPCGKFRGGNPGFKAVLEVDDSNYEPVIHKFVYVPITFFQATATSAKLSNTYQYYGGNSASVSVSTNYWATGTASILDGAKNIGTAKVSHGKASYKLPEYLSVGKHSIKAVYGGDSYFKTSSSKASTITVKAGPTKTTAKLSKSTQVYRSNSVAKLTVSTPKLVGTIMVYDGSRRLATKPTKGGSTVIAMPRTLARGNHNITARFTPSSHSYAASASSKVRLSVR